MRNAVRGCGWSDVEDGGLSLTWPTRPGGSREGLGGGGRVLTGTWGTESLRELGHPGLGLSSASWALWM